MGILNTLGWVFIVAQRKSPMRVGLSVLLIAIFGIGYCVVWFYLQGRNWARIAVLVMSVFSLLDLATLATSRPKNTFLVGAWGLLGAFFLYWLNTRPIREFFGQSKKQ
jgi:hypothetical protein